MIICGYQGVGKSTYCRNHVDSAIDLDSSNFKKVENWHKEYVKQAMHLSNSGKDVFISAHEIVVKEVLSYGQDFILLVPEEKEHVWRTRLEFRYAKNPSLPNLKAIHDFTLHFHDDMAFYSKIEKENNFCHVRRVAAKIVTSIEEKIHL